MSWSFFADDVDQPGPPPANANHPGSPRAAHGWLCADGGVQARHIAATSENSDHTSFTVPPYLRNVAPSSFILSDRKYIVAVCFFTILVDSIHSLMIICFPPQSNLGFVSRCTTFTWCSLRVEFERNLSNVVKRAGIAPVPDMNGWALSSAAQGSWTILPRPLEIGTKGYGPGCEEPAQNATIRSAVSRAKTPGLDRISSTALSRSSPTVQRREGPQFFRRSTSNAAYYRLTSCWHTPPRLSAACARMASILALCLWSTYLWNVATPGLLDRAGNLKGTDFLHLYTLGSLALAHGGADLYDMKAQSQLAAQSVPAAAGIRHPPLYPPQVSMFFSPFARLSYGCALVLWLTLSSLIYGVCCYTLWRVCLPTLRNHKLTVVILALAFPALRHVIAWGQTSALILACFTAAFSRPARPARIPRRPGSRMSHLQTPTSPGRRPGLRSYTRLAGDRRARFSQPTTQFAAAWLYYGPGPLRDWVRRLLSVPSLLPLLEPRLYQTHSLPYVLFYAHSLALGFFSRSTSRVLCSYWPGP